MARRRFLKKQAKSEEVVESEERLADESTEPVAVPDRSRLYNRLAATLLILSPLLFSPHELALSRL